MCGSLALNVCSLALSVWLPGSECGALWLNICGSLGQNMWLFGSKCFVLNVVLPDSGAMWLPGSKYGWRKLDLPLCLDLQIVLDGISAGVSCVFQIDTVAAWRRKLQNCKHKHKSPKVNAWEHHAENRPFSLIRHLGSTIQGTLDNRQTWKLIEV
jgi:hypothetical protein